MGIPLGPDGIPPNITCRAWPFIALQGRFREGRFQHMPCGVVSTILPQGAVGVSICTLTLGCVGKAEELGVVDVLREVGIPARITEVLVHPGPRVRMHPDVIWHGARFVKAERGLHLLLRIAHCSSSLSFAVDACRLAGGGHAISGRAWYAR